MQPTADSLRTGARRETARFLKFLVVGAAAFVVDTGSLSFFALVLTPAAHLVQGAVLHAGRGG